MATSTIARIETPLLRLLREEGRTQVWLARTIGSSRQQVGEWAHGLHVPSADYQRKMAQALGRQVEELWP